MNKTDLLQGKRVLIVDDEHDVLESLEELLDMCDVVQTDTFEAAKEMINNTKLDIAILDIMGVSGYELLDIAIEKGLTTVMLTANSLSVEDTKKSYVKGASLYIPKQEMASIVSLLTDVLEAKEAGKSTWYRWFERLGWYYDNRFGPDWKDSDKKFWNEIQNRKK